MVLVKLIGKNNKNNKNNTNALQFHVKFKNNGKKEIQMQQQYHLIN